MTRDAMDPSLGMTRFEISNESSRRSRPWRARSARLREGLPRSQARRGRRDRGGEGRVAELPRRLHAARHARHQGADAGHHGPRRRRRDRRGGPGRDRLEEGRPRAGRSDQPRRRRPDGRDGAWRPGRAVPRPRAPAGEDPRRRVVRRCGGAAGRLRHGAAHDGDQRPCREGREGADPRRLGRRRRVLPAARQARRRRGDRLRRHAMRRPSA